MQIKEYYFFFLSISVLLFFSSACEDPSNVGLGLLDDAGGAPIVEEVPFSSFESKELRGVTGGINRFLAGQVNDPVLGEFVSEGYIDFFSGVLPDEFASNEIDSIFLTLTTEYVYGDTLQEVVLDVFEVMNEFGVLDVTKDSLPAVDMTPIFQLSFVPTDTLVRAAFPQEWVSRKNADFRNEDFSDIFFGLKLAPVSGNAIVGFSSISTSGSALQSLLITSTDTFSVNYLAQKSISDFERLTPPLLPENRKLVQQGLGPSIRVDFDLTGLEDVSLNRAALQLQVDTLSLSDTPNFVRPAVNSVSLFGVFEDETLLTLANDIPMRDDGTLVIETLDFRTFIQRELLGENFFEYYELRFPTGSSNSLNSIVFHDTTSANNPPSFILTYTPLN